MIDEIWIPSSVHFWVGMAVVVTTLVSIGVTIENDGDLPDEVRATMGTFGLVSHAAFTASAFVAYNAFNESHEPDAEATTLSPFAAPRFGANGLEGVSVGLGGAF